MGISEPVDLLVDDGTELVPLQGIVRVDGDHAALGPFTVVATPDLAQGADRDSPGHPMEPARQRIGITDRARPSGQQQERHLERIFGQVAVGQQMPTDAKHHHPVTLDQGRERRFGRLTAANEVIQQAAIRHRPERPDVEERANLVAENDRRFPF